MPGLWEVISGKTGIFLPLHAHVFCHAGEQGLRGRIIGCNRRLQPVCREGAGLIEKIAEQAFAKTLALCSGRDADLPEKNNGWIDRATVAAGKAQ